MKGSETVFVQRCWKDGLALPFYKQRRFRVNNNNPQCYRRNWLWYEMGPVKQEIHDLGGKLTISGIIAEAN